VPFRVIGIIADIRQVPLGHPNEPVMYFAQRQFPFKSVYVIVGGADAALERVRHAVTSADPSVPLGRSLSLADRLRRESAPARLLMAVLLAFAIVTVILAVAGVYGILSWSVARRRRDLAIRMALGAQAKWLAARLGARAVLIGVASIATSVAVTRATSAWLEPLLFETRPADEQALGISALLILLFVVLASLLPMLRILRANPVDALSSE
jgi:putative ABC transport system permease protein